MIRSSIHQPIYYFETYINETGIASLKKEFYSTYIEHEQSPSINHEQECVTYYSGGFLDGEQIEWQTVYFQDHLKRLVNYQKDKSKTFIRQSFSQVQNPSVLLNAVFNELQDIEVNATKVFEKYSFLQQVIFELKRYTARKINLIKDLDNNEDNSTDSKRERINKIFKDWRTYNYMTNTEYDRFIECVYKFVTSFEISEIPEKFEIPKNESKKISRGMLYHLFHQLYITFGQRGQLDLVSQFMINIFTEFANKTKANLSSDLSNYTNPPTNFSY